MAAPMKLPLPTVAVPVLKIWTICLFLQLLFCSACDVFEGFLLCRKCGFELSKAQDLFYMPSKLAVGLRNDTIAPNQRVNIQLFKNPHGAYFEVITTHTANMVAGSQNILKDSWFPGYAWSIAKCPRCGAHIGWAFNGAAEILKYTESQISTFVGLILDKVMHQEEVKKLIIKPKLYHS